MSMLFRILTVSLLLCSSGLEKVSAGAPPLETAVTLFNAHRVPEARSLLAALTAREPENIQALWYLGRANLMMHRREDAIVVLERAVKLAPQDHHILADYGSACLLRADELGTTLKSIGYARRGRAFLEQAVALAPDELSYREGLVAFYKQAPVIVGGSMAKAYAQAAEIAKRNPLRGAVSKASIQAKEQLFDGARAACEEALRTQPDNYLALYTLGRIASESGKDLARGEQALRHCLDLTPAIQEPDFAGVHYRLGLIAEKAGHRDKARSEYATALGLEPTFKQATDALAALNESKP